MSSPSVGTSLLFVLVDVLSFLLYLLLLGYNLIRRLLRGHHAG
ncbi:MAG: hypothetical protein AB1449_01880 [Chloroflexota bacterium]